MASPSTRSDVAFDPYDGATARDPYALFRRMRDDAPLYYNEDQGFYALSRFEDVERGHINTGVFTSGRGVTFEMLKNNESFPPGTVVMEDDPTHQIHRTLLSRMFTARRISGLEADIRRICASLLDPHVEQGGFDFATDLGAQLPMRVIGMLVGIPDEDQEAVRDHFAMGRESNTAEVLSGALFADYIDWRAQHPSDDIMTHLLNAEFEDETGATRRLSRQELLTYVSIVAAAGNDTTKHLITWTGKILAEHPDERRRLAADPDLIPIAVNEVLRLEPQSLHNDRYVAEDVDCYGETVPEGSIMFLMVGAANRDERHYADPDRFDLDRGIDKHFSFGWGAHFCLGQALARLEGQIVIEEVLKRFPDWEVDWDGASFYFHPDFRAWDALPVVAP